VNHPPVGTTDQIRRIDRMAIEDYGLPGIVLMENAGRGAARIALDMLPEPSKARVIIFCGKGANGGDGFVIARYLHNAGVDVATCLTARIEDISPGSDAGVNLQVAHRMGIAVEEIADPEAADAAGGRLADFDLVVDALLGTGLAGEVREPARTLIERINACGRPVLAVDIPSGLCGDTGRVLGVAIRARCTATFAAAKQGFFLAEGPNLVGRLDVVDIGVPRQVLDDCL